MGREEGVKGRPCAIVTAVQEDTDGQRVYVLPITHALPQPPDEGIELPLPTKVRLGLDGERSWVIVSEANRFSWPGPRPDLRPMAGLGPQSVAYGLLRPGMFRVVRDRFVARALVSSAKLVSRTK